MADGLFVPEDFAVQDGPTVPADPRPPRSTTRRSRRLDVQHRPHPHDAQVPYGSWLHQMLLSDNLRNPERHAQDFAERRGFTYTVLAAGPGEVIGCVYIYPRKDEPGARVRSWVLADRAELDAPVYEAVSSWLRTAWPFTSVTYAPR